MNTRDTSEPQPRRPPRSDFNLIGYVDQTLDALNGKWKVHLLFFMARGIHRHSRLLDCLPGTSKKIMTDTLRALERDGLVRRTVYAQVPVRVEYSLTPLGWTITQPLISLAGWGEEHAAEVAKARLLYGFRGSTGEPNPPRVRRRPERMEALAGDRTVAESERATATTTSVRKTL
jgi:DNA-binding HxlR family transcriptional regulator